MQEERMRHYRTHKIEIKKLDEIICNCCGKKISVINEVPQEDIVEVEKHWGYLSKKDGQKDAFDLCEDCYDRIVSGFSIPVTCDS